MQLHKYTLFFTCAIYDTVNHFFEIKEVYKILSEEYTFRLYRTKTSSTFFMCYTALLEQKVSSCFRIIRACVSIEPCNLKQKV